MSAPLADALLHGLAADLLDPGDALAVRRAAGRDPGLAQALGVLQTRAGAVGATALGQGTAVLDAQAAPLLDAAASRELTLRVPQGAIDPACLPVLLRTDGGVVEVLHPTTAARFVPLARLPHADGRYTLRVLLPHPEAALELLLVPEGTAWEDPDDEAPWSRARAAAARGALAGWKVERGAV
ncbi:MAG: hypothetical protein H6732_14135 [Alphaproteobacteria bacterium]|nr:hypothetical protein [Alphaproteobacteria bacterium]